MTYLDWAIVAGLMILVFGFAGARSRKTKTNVDWFLGGRSLPFWMAGVSMFATSVDGGEYIAMNGATYQDGLVMISGLVFGVGVGGVVAAFLVVPSMYRAGLITNAEYLEGRYGPGMRVISALVQIQYRTSTLATVAVALHLVFTEVVRLDSQAARLLVVIVAAGTTLYSAWGGLKTVAAADLLLSAMMLTAIVVGGYRLWCLVVKITFPGRLRPRRVLAGSNRTRLVGKQPFDFVCARLPHQEGIGSSGDPQRHGRESDGGGEVFRFTDENAGQHRCADAREVADGVLVADRPSDKSPRRNCLSEGPVVGAGETNARQRENKDRRGNLRGLGPDQQQRRASEQVAADDEDLADKDGPSRAPGPAVG